MTQRVEPGVWRGLAVFVVRDVVAAALDEAVAGVARGLEILETVVLTRAQRSRLTPDAYALIVACDVTPPEGATGVRSVAQRVADVLDHTRRRLSPDGTPAPLVDVSSGPREALAFLAALGDPDLPTRLLPRVQALTAACAVPFPLVGMLGGDSPGFRSRVALVDHPVHGRSVCKIFRPGADVSFQRELRARTELADLPEVPELLEHGPNWLLTPFYADSGAHVVRPLPGGLAQLHPHVVRDLVRFVRDLHERGRYVLDLSPHNLVTDPDAGLKILDLEFVLDYPAPQPEWEACWSLHGVPQALRSVGDGLPNLVLTKGVGNSVFHPAVCGLRRTQLLAPGRRRETPRRVARQLAWSAALGVAGRVHPAFRP
ncbi:MULTISPECIES: hypothetical protein [Pseudonocardia]|uniref:hypothetical protein n=1 Tax=Pseudonocardia TaxID=1847 RepID=UPI0015A1766E|nr:MULTISPECIES: hypothetical protein [Pseudonocardia]MCF7550401.1 hypothetical protein [Pseudonocardia sp. WMMC193]